MADQLVAGSGMSSIHNNSPLFRSALSEANSASHSAPPQKFRRGDPITPSAHRVEKSDILLLVGMMSSESENVWTTALALLCRIGRLAVPALIKALNDESEQTRMLAANALGYIGDVEAIAPLMKTLHDSSSEVREASREALRALVAIFMQPTRVLSRL